MCLRLWHAVIIKFVCERTLRGHVHSAFSVKWKSASRQHMGHEHKQRCPMPWTVSSPQHWQLRWWVWQEAEHPEQHFYLRTLSVNVCVTYKTLTLAQNTIHFLLRYFNTTLLSLFSLFRNIIQSHVDQIVSPSLRCRWMTWRA